MVGLFAAQKVAEVNILAKALAGSKDEFFFFLSANGVVQASRKSSPSVTDEEVKKAVAALKDSDHRRRQRGNGHGNVTKCVTLLTKLDPNSGGINDKYLVDISLGEASSGQPTCAWIAILESFSRASPSPSRSFGLRSTMRTSARAIIKHLPKDPSA